MNTTPNQLVELSMGAQIFLALELDRASALRKIAATLVFRYIMELHRYGYVDSTWRQIDRICGRFHLGDFATACLVHYPIKNGGAK